MATLANNEEKLVRYYIKCTSRRPEVKGKRYESVVLNVDQRLGRTNEDAIKALKNILKGTIYSPKDTDYEVVRKRFITVIEDPNDLPLNK